MDNEGEVNVGDSWVIPSLGLQAPFPGPVSQAGREELHLSNSKEGPMLPAHQGMGRAWTKVVDGIAGFRVNDITLYTLMQFLPRLELGTAIAFYST